MMAVTVLLGKTLASSRRLDSVLDTSRLKHTIILVNPRLWMLRMLDMVPAVPKQDQHLKGYRSTCKTIALCQDSTCCAEKSYLFQWLCDFWVNFCRVTADEQQWLHVGPNQMLNSNAKLLPEIEHSQKNTLRPHKQQISWKSNPCRENGYLSGK